MRTATKQFSRRRWVVPAACIVLVAAPLFASATPAAAGAGGPAPAPRSARATVQVTPNSSWVIVPTPNPSGDWGRGALDVLRGVSCVSSNFCMAAGSYVPRPQKAGVYRSYPLFERWDGSEWSVAPSPTGGGMAGISCSSVHFCMAVGVTNVKNGGSHLGESSLAEVWRGAAWSIAPSPPPPPGVPAYEAQLASVACTSRNSCLAVGSYGQSRSPRTQTLIESWDGSRWSINHSPSPGGSPGGLNALSAVSCTAAGGPLCAAVGYEAASTNSRAHAIIEVDHHGTWSLDLTAAAPDFGSSHFFGVSCSSATVCLAVGDLIAGSSHVLLEGYWDRPSWHVVPTAPSALVGVAVTCSSRDECTEVGPSGQISTLDGVSWTAVATPPHSGVSASSVSCAPSICTAVGDYVVGGMTHSWAEYRRVS